MTAKAVIIDCDPGIDDAIALLAALHSPALTLLGITVVNGNRPLAVTLRNALQITELAESDVPVYGGCWQPMVREPLHGRFHGEGGLGACELPPPVQQAAPQHAVTFLIARCRQAALQGEPLTLCALGPLTNIATALRLAPDIVAGIERVVLMGGACRESGNSSLYAEYNMLADPHAAHILFSSSLAITMLPLDVTHQVMLTPEKVATLTKHAGRIRPQLQALMASWDRNDIRRYGSRGGPLHDPLVIAWLLQPALFTTERARVFVELESQQALGRTTADWFGKSGEAANVDIATGVDAEGVFALFCQLFGRYAQDLI
ncbi:nucleoside hydrolase [Erwiniaceae bacterium BAC15a-03b]|uniref:Nucleoside hydrolase n=1 Tax=Winslowiella arboricola TaxID=2978220 RepID=A0A9J6PX98_9GAMM|nr:nucleoside hydrolase [Winslowiella arboricola]MCU5775673.1 nucleoside hydrolase [Winslowiella arboricola]MCU5779476.1 nucleoside hydrolase [Winslowiella arboricola]